MFSISKMRMGIGDGFPNKLNCSGTSQNYAWNFMFNTLNVNVCLKGNFYIINLIMKEVNHV